MLAVAFYDEHSSGSGILRIMGGGSEFLIVSKRKRIKLSMMNIEEGGAEFGVFNNEYVRELLMYVGESI